MSTREFVSVYRSSKNSDTYLYVRRSQVWDELPEPLRAAFSRPVHVMDLLLTPDRKLARTTGREVLGAIEAKDFYLQMPEEQDTYVVEFKRTIEQYRK